MAPQEMQNGISETMNETWKAGAASTQRTAAAFRLDMARGTR